MKSFFLAAMLLLSLSSLSFSQTKKSIKAKNKSAGQIKQYWFVMLIAGNNRSHDSSDAAKIQEGHMANINRLYYEGKLKVAGPFGDEGTWKGIFIFDCNTRAEVEKLLSTDPALVSGRLAYQVHPWWTAATGSFSPGKPIKKP